MNVVVDARMATHGGIGTYLQNLVPRVSAARPGWAMTLLGDPDSMTALGWNGLPNVSMRRCRSSYYTLAEQVEIPLRCPENTDVFWAPHYNVPLLLRRARAMVVTVHDVCHLALSEATDGWLEQGYARFMFSRMARTASAILCVSEFSRTELGRFVTPRARTSVSPNGVDESWFSARALAPETPLAKPYLVYVGNWKRHKNVPTLLRAFGRVRDRIPHQLVLVGKSDGLNADKGIDREAASLGDRVVHAGEVDDAQVKRWVAHADALVTTSLYEGFGLPPLEAMAAGTPCMVSTAGSLPEVCGDAALYCDPHDADMVAARLVEIASDAVLRLRLIELGRARAREFTWERCTAITLDALDRAATERT